MITFTFTSNSISAGMIDDTNTNTNTDNILTIDNTYISSVLDAICESSEQKIDNFKYFPPNKIKIDPIQCLRYNISVRKLRRFREKGIGTKNFKVIKRN